MKEYEWLYQIKNLEKNIALFIAKDSYNCDNFSPPTPTQIIIVNYILEHDKENIYQKDLEKNLNLTRATLSGVLKTMEKNGIIKREINNNDARSKKIILSDEMEQRFIESQNRLADVANILTKDIDKEEIEIFKEVLNKMKDNISKYNTDKERNDKYVKTNEKL